MDMANLKPETEGQEAEASMLAQGVSLGRWRNFARRSQRIGAMVDFVLERQEHKCALCDGPSRGKFHLHHTDYMHACILDTKTPDCMNCKAETPDAFHGCASRLAAVHPRCHYKIHQEEIEVQKGKSLPKSRRCGISMPKTRESPTTSRDQLRKMVMDIYDDLSSNDKSKEKLLKNLESAGLTITRNSDNYFTAMSEDGRRVRFRWENLDLAKKQMGLPL
jgi:hypothetical protein